MGTESFRRRSAEEVTTQVFKERLFLSLKERVWGKIKGYLGRGRRIVIKIPGDKMLRNGVRMT